MKNAWFYYKVARLCKLMRLPIVYLSYSDSSVDILFLFMALKLLKCCWKR